MGVIQEFFNNREIAIGIWVIIGLAVILPTKPARQFIKTAIPILFCKKFVIFYIVFLSFFGFGVVRIKLGRTLGSHFVKRHCLLGILC